MHPEPCTLNPEAALMRVWGQNEGSSGWEAVPKHYQKQEIKLGKLGIEVRPLKHPIYMRFYKGVYRLDKPL